MTGASRGFGPADRTPIPLKQMPGDQAKVVAAMIDAASSADPPRRLLLGSGAYRLVREALTDPIAGIEAQKDLAASTDSTADPSCASGNATR